MEEKSQQMFKSKVCATVQEVIFPEFPEDDNTVTTTVTKSRRVSFGTNFIKEFIVGSAVSATCVSEYEQAFSSSDSSNPNSSHSAVESDTLDHGPPFPPENSKIHSTGPPVSKSPYLDSAEHSKPAKFSGTIYFSDDSSIADMEFTEGCIQLAKMFKMRQSKLTDDKDFMMEDSKENRMPLNLIMRELDKDDSDFDLFNTTYSMSMEIENQENLDERDVTNSLHLEQKCVEESFRTSVQSQSEPLLVDVNTTEDSEEQSKECIKDQSEPLLVDFNTTEGSEEQSKECVYHQSEPVLADVKMVVDSEEQSRECVHNQSEPLLVDVKVIEDLEEQSKESNCVWTLQDVRYPNSKTLGLLSLNCTLLQSPTILQFTLKKSEEFCSVITESSVCLKEDVTPMHPEYNQVLNFGFKKQEEYFNEQKQKIKNIRNIPIFLDEINSFMIKINSYLKQVYEILISYPGSSLTDTILSFRLFSYPIFFSSTVSIDLTNLFKLSESSLSFKRDIGRMDEKKIRHIFQDCLKHDNCLCEFVIRSSKYLFDIERASGLVSKRSHIRLLPAELRL